MNWSSEGYHHDIQQKLLNLPDIIMFIIIVSKAPYKAVQTLRTKFVLLQKKHEEKCSIGKGIIGCLKKCICNFLCKLKHFLYKLKNACDWVFLWIPELTFSYISTAFDNCFVSGLHGVEQLLVPMNRWTAHNDWTTFHRFLRSLGFTSNWMFSVSTESFCQQWDCAGSFPDCLLIVAVLSGNCRDLQAVSSHPAVFRQLVIGLRLFIIMIKLID